MSSLALLPEVEPIGGPIGATNGHKKEPWPRKTANGVQVGLFNTQQEPAARIRSGNEPTDYAPRRIGGTIISARQKASAMKTRGTNLKIRLGQQRVI